MDRIEAMAAFVAVADLRGFAPAARRLKMSPSATTRLIAALEDRLGTRLLQRTTRSVSLTDAGSRYLQRARQILADLAEAESEAHAEHVSPTGHLVVAAPNMFGRLHVAPLMCTYLARYPVVTGELMLADRMVNMVEDGIDVAVRIGVLEDSGLVARPVGSTRRVVVASPEYLAIRGAPTSLDQIADHDVIRFSALNVSPEWKFAGGEVGDNQETVRVPILPRYVTNSADAAIGHATLGGGLTMVLAYQVRDAILAGKLRIVLAPFELPPLPIQVVYPTSRLVSAKVRAFIELAVACDWRFGN